MAEEKLNLPAGYDPEADPVDVTERAPRGTGDLVEGLRRLGRVNAQLALLDARRKKLQSELMEHMRKPILMQHPVTHEPVIVAAAQARPIKVDVNELRTALFDHFYDEGAANQAYAESDEELDNYRAEIADKVDVIVKDVLKDPEVDTKEGGRFVQACERDGPNKIPLEVVAKVAKEKPSSAYIGFNPLRSNKQ